MVRIGLAVGGGGHGNWLLPPRGRQDGYPAPLKEGGSWVCGEQFYEATGQWRTEHEQEAMALAADSRLGPLTPGGSIQGPQLSVTQEVLEVAEVPVITIRVTPPPLTGHHPPGRTSAVPLLPVTLCLIIHMWKWSNATLLWALLHRNEDHSSPLYSLRWISSLCFMII